MGHRAYGSLERLAVGRDESACERGSTGKGHLLPENGADRELFRLDHSGHSASRSLLHDRPEELVAFEGSDDGCRVGVEVEQAAGRRDRRIEIAWVL